MKSHVVDGGQRDNVFYMQRNKNVLLHTKENRNVFTCRERQASRILVCLHGDGLISMTKTQAI